MKIRLGGDETTVESAVDWLSRCYPKPTVRYYDGGGPSSRNSVELADLGRMVVFAAQLKFDQGVHYLDRGASRDAPWPEGDTDWQLADPAATPFPSAPTVDDASKLFEHFRTSRGGNTAQISKLLHLKWPDFFPVVDRAMRHQYLFAATAIHSKFFGEEDNEWATWAKAYWAAFRDDLIANERSLEVLRTDLRNNATRLEDPDDRDHCERLSRLSSLRLQDALAWGRGSGRWQPGNEPRISAPPPASPGTGVKEEVRSRSSTSGHDVEAEEP